MMGVNETTPERLQRQRDNAWDALRAIEANLGEMDEMGIAFFLAGAIEQADAAEYAMFCEERAKEDLQHCREVPKP